MTLPVIDEDRFAWATLLRGAAIDAVQGPRLKPIANNLDVFNKSLPEFIVDTFSALILPIGSYGLPRPDRASRRIDP